MARHFSGSGHIVRFIEYMDVGATNGWRMDDVVPAREIVRMIGARDAARARRRELPRAKSRSAGATRDGGGEIGVIASVTQAFCRDCTRARLSTDGKLYTCLFASDGYDLRELLRGGRDDERSARAVAAIWRQRGDRYSEIRTAEHGARAARSR